MITLKEIKRDLNKLLEKTILTPKLFLSKLKVGVNQISGNLTDPTYMPFYYYLGTLLPETENLMEIGFDLGLPCCCFMNGCPKVKTFLAFRKKDNAFHAKRLGISNVHNTLKKKFGLWVGEESDPELIKMVLSYTWNCVIIADEFNGEKSQRAYLDLVWSQVSDGGIIVVDFIKNEAVNNAYTNFCKTHNREPFLLNTFRGTGLIQK
jgi:hypothetical protein